MKFVLVHPSRGRAEKAFDTYRYWMSKASGSDRNVIDHVLSIDFDDRERMIYFELFADHSRSIVCSRNADVVEATNVGARIADGDVLIYLSDDFKCPDRWDESLAAAFDNVVDMPFLLKVDDCLQPFGKAVTTIPIMTKALYDRLGYFWHPAYRSMFVDIDLYWTCKNNGWLRYAAALKFPHEHWCNLKAQRDETYARSDRHWNQGELVFAQREKDGFPLLDDRSHPPTTPIAPPN